ncbi:hypothetical protein PCANC_26713 [Puccinia coronata f. sp. avenae]|uniref:Uncharacterized protein n=1 Tax=Puccinia coronata f. sp. avenae TaxID=200324 RepID=A0A2N5S920_9BASI|nr:hypothetical protein PCANC_26713 [Puccinia coronata f. sp. avenae]
MQAGLPAALLPACRLAFQLHCYQQGLDRRACARPPERLKKRRAGAARLPTQACKPPARPPPHAARRPHAYKWREDGRLGVRPRRTGVLAMHACLEGVQALHALRTGVHGWHACLARLT